jgi:hypothetical protein
MLALGLLHSTVLNLQAEPIRLHPGNPHYFLWRGQPGILITAGEHYGAVLNRDFNYRRYLEELKRHRFNLTRIFPARIAKCPVVQHHRQHTGPGAWRFHVRGRAAKHRRADGETKFDLQMG